ncbi:MAG: hypothetical protein WCL11_29865, partial [Verrucomicrobiota bacterium]
FHSMEIVELGMVQSLLWGLLGDRTPVICTYEPIPSTMQPVPHCENAHQEYDLMQEKRGGRGEPRGI